MAEPADGRPAKHGRTKTIVTFAISSLLVLSDLHDHGEVFRAVNQALYQGVQSLNPWGLLQTYLDAYSQLSSCPPDQLPPCQTTWSGAVAFFPATAMVVGAAFHHSVWSAIFMLAGVAIALIAGVAVANDGNDFNPLFGIFAAVLTLVAESVAAWLVQGFTLLGLSAVGWIFEGISFVAVPTLAVSYMERGHTLMSLVESFKSLRESARVVKPKV